MSEHMNTPWTYNNDSGRVEGQHHNPKMGTVHIADMRGWGYLTGLTEGYALSLSEAEAMEVQRRRGELLAAAPDLLAALKGLRNMVDVCIDLKAFDPVKYYAEGMLLDEYLSAADAAITRAEGGGGGEIGGEDE